RRHHVNVPGHAEALTRIEAISAMKPAGLWHASQGSFLRNRHPDRLSDSLAQPFQPRPQAIENRGR
ncbi:MAG: hypothetical protein Q8R51_15140, partial [Azonexus sp.]|nr:hypothetical protein [Azonexus sp.]